VCAVLFSSACEKVEVTVDDLTVSRDGSSLLSEQGDRCGEEEGADHGLHDEKCVCESARIRLKQEDV